MPGNVQYVFCSDEYLLAINKQFLKHDYYTDIITFDLGAEDRIDAEIYISLDRVKENAASFNDQYKRELLRVIFHGALHLSGYADKTKSEITLMREKENEYLKRFEKSNPSRKMPLKKLLFLFLLLPFAAIGQSVVVLEQRKISFNLVVDEEVESWNRSFHSYELLSKQEKEILYWTNYSRKDPVRFWDSVMVPILVSYPQLRGKFALSLKADLQAAKSLPLLALNDTLILSARQHALDIGMKTATVSHTSTNGTTFSRRLQNLGVRNCGSENMSLGSGDILLSIAMLYLDQGLENLGHRKTLLNADYIYVGIGATKYGLDQLFFVQDFACSQD